MCGIKVFFFPLLRKPVSHVMTTVISEFGFLLMLEFCSSGLRSVLMVVRGGDRVPCVLRYCFAGFVLFLPCLLTYWYFLMYRFNFGDHVLWGIFFPHCSAGRILVLWPGSKPMPPAVEACGPNRWSNVFKWWCGRGLNNKYKVDICYPSNRTGACTQHHGWFLIFVFYFSPCFF